VTASEAGDTPMTGQNSSQTYLKFQHQAMCVN
jgi:hypothetical protein